MKIYIYVSSPRFYTFSGMKITFKQFIYLLTCNLSRFETFWENVLRDFIFLSSVYLPKERKALRIKKILKPVLKSCQHFQRWNLKKEFSKIFLCIKSCIVFLEFRRKRLRDWRSGKDHKTMFSLKKKLRRNFCNLRRFKVFCNFSLLWILYLFYYFFNSLTTSSKH